jgi:hypothetical protein
MSGISLSTLRLAVAEVGPDNPLPLLQSLERLERPSMTAAPADLPEGMAERLEYGRVVGGYPYTCQDGYGRKLVEHELQVAVLENSRLRAVFLLGYGGRLWSLQDLGTGRELLFNPGKIQLANLGMRNAWFAGGVEWNLGTAAHSPFTCAPLHAAQARGPRGEPALRLYEYERLRGVPFQIDAWLADDEPLLKVHVRIRNPSADAVPMWWWSNVAVPETPDVRIIAPADNAWYYKYNGEGLQQTVLPLDNGADVTYPGRSADAAEYFFHPSRGSVRWIAAVDGAGAGLVQASTSRLFGRKVFRWGTGPGGRRWQDWLGDAERPYLEIQGGITATQMEHVRFPAGQTWSWVEAYGPLHVDPGKVHHDWTTARAAVAHAIAGTAGIDLEADLAGASVAAQLPPGRELARGSGWGALEEMRRELAGESALADAGAPFSAHTIGTNERPWLTLLTNADMCPSPDEPPNHNVKGGDWAQRLAAVGAGWLPLYLRGLLAHAEQDHARARQLYENSLAERPTPWALRALALLDVQNGLTSQAADRYWAAHKLWPSSTHLAVEAADALLGAGRPEQALVVVREVPDARRRGRLRMLEARALAETGHIERARNLIEAGIEVPDLREGEQGLDVLWARLYPDTPVPGQYDFRMRNCDGAPERN